MAEVDLRALGAADIRERYLQWRDLYNRCFGEPPWNEPARSDAELLERNGWHFDRPGLRGLEATDTEGRTVGLAYGWISPAEPIDRPFYRGLVAGLVAGLGDRAARELFGAGPFEVVELMVDPAARGQGLGGRLLRTIVDGEPLCWLATSPDAPAAALYKREGWAPVVRFDVEGGIPLELYTLDRRGDRNGRVG